MRLTVFFVTVLLASAAACSDHDGYVGSRHPPLPKDVVSLSGWVLMTPAFLRPRLGGTVFGMSFVETPSGDMVWLDTLIGELGDSRVQWEVVAVVPIPPRDSTVSMVESCAVGTEDRIGKVIALVQGDQEIYETVLRSWRANLDSLRIDEIPTDNVVCINEAFGV